MKAIVAGELHGNYDSEQRRGDAMLGAESAEINGLMIGERLAVRVSHHGSI